MHSAERIDDKLQMNSNWNAFNDLIYKRATIFVHFKIQSATKNVPTINFNSFSFIQRKITVILETDILSATKYGATKNVHELRVNIFYYDEPPDKKIISQESPALLFFHGAIQNCQPPNLPIY